MAAEGILKLDDSICVSLEGMEISSWDTGALIVRTGDANPVGKQNSVHHGDLQLALLSRAQKLNNIELRFGSRVVDINIEETAVLVATGERVVGDLIIAADGVKSTVRQKVWPPEASSAQPSGEAAYRMTLPQQLLETDEELLALVQRPWARRWDGPDSHVVAYPLRNHQVLNVVLIHQDDSQVEESWATTADKARVVTAFQAWNTTVRKLINLAPDNVANFRIFLHSPSPVWAKGSVVLLGDACHAML